MTKYIEYDEEGTLIANNTASSYVRVSYNIADDHLTVNGNYFTVDGSQLIVITPDDDNLYPDQPGSLTIAGAPSDVCNSQSSMFLQRYILQRSILIWTASALKTPPCLLTKL